MPSLHGLIVDKDGTLVRQGEAVEGAFRALNQCRIPFVIASNTGVKGPDEVDADLCRLGLSSPAPPPMYIRTASQDLAHLLSSLPWRAEHRLVVLSPSPFWRKQLPSELFPFLLSPAEAESFPRPQEVRVALFTDGKLLPDGEDEHAALSLVCTLASRGAAAYLTSCDPYLVSATGALLPGPGALLAAIRTVVPSASITVCGKGGSTSFFSDCAALLRGLGFCGGRRNILVVGDRVGTDMEASSYGMQTCLVETGCDTEDDALSASAGVHAIAKSLSDIPFRRWDGGAFHYAGILLRSEVCKSFPLPSAVLDRAKKVVPPRRVWTTGDLRSLS